jgi:DNA-binding CsgD family transcriptional regulator
VEIGWIMNKDIIKQQVKKHLSLASAEEIRAICKPLEDHFGVKSLVYKSVRNDGKETILTTHPEWIDYFFENGLYKGSALEKEPSNYVKGELLWSHIKTHNEILTATREGFDIDNGITLIRPFDEGCEFYYIGASRDNYKARQLLNNNIDLLDKFAHYFKSQLETVIDKASAQPLMIQDKFKENKISVDKIPCYQNQAMRSAFLNDIYKDGINLSINGKNTHLTKREYKIAKEFLKGKTMQQIGDDLFISPRTVETHLDNMKVKFQVRKKSELLMILSTHL